MARSEYSDQSCWIMGADSLRMFQIASRAHHRGLAVSAKQLMQLHTVEAVAAAVDTAKTAH